MTFAFKYVRNFLYQSNAKLLSNYGKNVLAVQCKTFKTSSKNEKSKTNWKTFGFVSALGVTTGAAYSYNKISNRNYAVLNAGNGEKSVILKELPKIDNCRRISYPNDTSGLEIVLFQYPTCPFCCKVRAFLDFHGLSYDIVEVNPVLRQQLKWTSYKKVPILLVKLKDGYIQLNDSTMIISVLTSYLKDKEMNIKQLADFYPSITFKDDDGGFKQEILNRYFIMLQAAAMPKEIDKEIIEDERKWRKWADDVLVHTLSPNVYRSKEEALQAFNWFSEVGQWSKLFPVWEQYLVVYVGAFAMWIIGKRLKKKYHLKDDVRQSLYDECNLWLRELKKKGSPFHGGKRPDLADLAVYGVLSSIEGCIAFNDLLENTKLNSWYSEMKRQIVNQAGVNVAF